MCSGCSIIGFCIVKLASIHVGLERCSLYTCESLQSPCTAETIAVNEEKMLMALSISCDCRLYEDFLPGSKVADIGMSKLFDEEMTEGVTKRRGAPGYLAPEWLLQTGITEKCDVYSYGMVLLEIVSGRKNIDLNASLEKWYFPAWAVQRMQEQAWKEIMDVRLESPLTLEGRAHVKKVVKIAMWCIQDSPRLTPTMAAGVQMQKGVVEDPPSQFDFLAIGSREDVPVISNSSIGSVVGHSSTSSEFLQEERR